MCVFWVAPQTYLLLHQICHQRCFWIPSMVVFEMHDAKKCVSTACRPKRAYLGTKYATNSVFGYLVCVCLKCTMPKNVCFLARCPRRAYLCTEYATSSIFGYLVCVYLKCTMPKKCVLGVAPHTHIHVHQVCLQQCFWIPSMRVFERHSAKKVCLLRAALFVIVALRIVVVEHRFFDFLVASLFESMFGT